MNNKNAMPVNGIRFKARKRICEWVTTCVVDPGGLAGLEFPIGRWLVTKSKEKKMPAMAAARGLFRLLCIDAALGSLLPPTRIIA
jgi:hypothetical protein